MCRGTKAGYCQVTRMQGIATSKKVQCVCAQSCPTFCDPLDYSLPDPFLWNFPGKNIGVGCHAPFRGSSQPRDWTRISYVPALAGRFFTSATWEAQTAAAAKSLQSCPSLCDPIDGSPPGSPVPGILQARTLEWAAISFSSA